MTKIAFLGLGLMGSPMATRLVDAGHGLTVWNRTAEKTRTVVERGARAASTPAEAAAGVEIAITMLSDPDALEQVLFGPDGIATAVPPPGVLVDMSTVGPDTIRSVRDRVPGGVAVVDAPVRGSISEATEGRLIVLVGAEESDFRLVEPVLSTLGTVHLVGGPGAGAAMKLVANSTLGAAITGAAEAIALGDALGLDRARVLDMLAESPLGAVIRPKRENIEAGEYPPRFKLRLALKDLRLVTDAAAEAGRELRVAEASREWLQDAADDGRGDQDYTAVIATITGDRRTSG